MSPELLCISLFYDTVLPTINQQIWAKIHIKEVNR
jgi:hypothetical protein